MSRYQLSRTELAHLAREARLTVVGVATAEPFEELSRHLIDHVERGHMRGMDWFTVERAAQSCDPRSLHASVRSIVSVGLPFWGGPAHKPDDGVLRGRIARYAWGRDYHGVLKRRMRVLIDGIESAIGHAVEARALVDTARIVDRAAAARAGIGWYGKNTMIIVPGHGSWVMLGELLLDVALQPDVPLQRNCGRCTICLDRCPTGAIVAPYRVDAPRCISYLTIEERGAIPHHLRPMMGDNVFGCDICQDVCPYTRAATVSDDAEFAPRTVDNAFPSLAFLATMTEEQFRATFSGTAVTRAKRRGMARNAAIALGNSGDARAEPPLHALLQHDDPLARGHAAVALRQLIGTEALPALQRTFARESDAYVRGEIAIAIDDRGHAGGGIAATG